MWRLYLMLLWRVPKNNSGFTLLEMLVAAVIVGVIAAISVPNLLGLLNRNRINDAMGQVEGALKEAQKQAIRNGKGCSVTINANEIINPVSDGCLLSNRDLHDLVQLNSSRASIAFSGKGNITINDSNLALNIPTPVIVISMASGNGTNVQRCVVIQNSLGSIRTGTYSGAIPATPLPASCQST